MSMPRDSLHLRVRGDHQPITSLTWAEAVGDEADEMGNMRKVKELLLLVGAGLLQKKCDALLPKRTRNQFLTSATTSCRCALRAPQQELRAAL